MLDDVDRRILRQLQAEPEIPQGELAVRCNLTVTTLSRRIARMRDEGVILGQRIEVNWSALGYEVEVSLRVTLDKTASRAFEEFMDAARDVPEVIEIQTFLGQVDVRLQVIARDLAHYQQLYRGRILALPHIADIEALMHVARVQADAGLPV